MNITWEDNRLYSLAIMDGKASFKNRDIVLKTFSDKSNYDVGLKILDWLNQNQERIIKTENCGTTVHSLLLLW